MCASVICSLCSCGHLSEDHEDTMRLLPVIEILYLCISNIPRHECVPFHVVLVGGDELISAAAQALVAAHTSDLPPDRLTFFIVPTGRQQCV